MAVSNECISLLSIFLKVVGCTYMLEGKKCQNLCVTSFSCSRLPLRQLIFKTNSEIVYVILVSCFFSCLAVVLVSLASSDGSCVCNRSFCRKGNMFIPNHFFFVFVGLVDEQQKVRTITALALAALAEAATPYGIESFDSVLKPLWKGIRQHRGKVRLRTYPVFLLGMP